MPMHDAEVCYCTECRFNENCGIHKTMAVCVNIAHFDIENLFCAVGSPKEDNDGN